MYSVVIKVFNHSAFVYRTKIQDINDLKQKITDAIATTDEAMLQQTWQEIEYLLDVFRPTNGAHIEVY